MTAARDAAAPPEHDPADRPRTAVVAGGTGELGSAVVELLLERGERVAVPWRSAAGADVLAGRHRAAVRDRRLWLAKVDVTVMEHLGAFLDVVCAEWGPLWLACSTVGRWAGGVRVEDMPDLGMLEGQLRTNLYPAVVVAAEGLRHMGPAGGRVVLVGSRVAFRPSGGQTAYSISKAGVHTLVQSLAEELRGTGRTANAVVPGVIATEANRASMPQSDQRRWVPSRQIAEVVGWLASPEAGVVSGATVPVYGDS